jgi:exopolyphosphatase/guanosine-5'-triphosphate,3'-diphosphate pyrophosphatase
VAVEQETRRAGVAASDAPAPVFAALDLGTNNCRLLVARAAGGGFRVIDAFSRIVRLGEGLSRSNHFSAEAIDRTLAALRVCSHKIKRRAATAVRAVATEACRRADDCGEFLALARRETGIVIEIISSREEARLALTGCAPLLDRGIPHALVFDIGGGSTELMWIAVDGGRRPRLIDQTSIPLGVVSLTELYGGDRIAPSVYATMVADLVGPLAAFEARNGIAVLVRRGAVQMLGTSGTATTLAGVHMGLARYDRSRVDGSYLAIGDARAVCRRLCALDYAERAAHPCIGRDRADLVVAGCAILEAICDAWPVTRVRIADRGLREGILTDLIAAARA